MFNKASYLFWTLKSSCDGLCSSLSGQLRWMTSRSYDARLTHISKLLDCGKDELDKTLLPPSLLTKCPTSVMDDSYRFLERTQFSKKLLRENPWLLLYPTVDLRRKLGLVSSGLGLTAENVPLLRLSLHRLLAVVRNLKNEQMKAIDSLKDFNQSRLRFLAHHLQCTVQELAGKMDKHYRLLTLDFDKLSRITFLLLKAGVSRDNIRNDLWVYHHNEELMRERISRAKSAGVDPIKTWMMRCPESVFVNVLDKTYDAKDVLGIHKDSVTYLAERFQCSQGEVIQLQKRYPRLLKINPRKIKQVLDFIYANGFTPKDAMSTPRVLSTRFDTLNRRMQQLNESGYSGKKVYVLCISNTAFQTLIDKLNKSREGVNQ